MLKIRKKINIILASFILSSCNEQPTSFQENSSSFLSEEIIEKSSEVSSEIESSSNKVTNILITINLSSGKKINCELYPDVAPISVENFINLIESGFYDNTIFHRIVPNFVIQGGGFYIENKTIYQKEANTIKGEFDANGITNDLSHEKGVLSMARSNSYDSASSQFFICVADCKSLDGKYAAFGKVIDETSLNVAINMSMQVSTTVSYLSNFPINPIAITSIEIN